MGRGGRVGSLSKRVLWQASVASLLAARVATAEPVRHSERAIEGPSAPSGAGTAEAPISALLALSFGRGLRFNNPYRLATPLGDSAESVSLAATYLDLGGALLFGPGEFRQGMALGGSVALQGIGQLVLTPSYLALFGLSEEVAFRGRAGIPVVVAPDTTAGLEAAVGTSLGVAYGLGVVAELVGSIFFGAATDERSVTTIPMLSLQLGIYFDHQVAR
jgi:hypothetical protein